MDYQLIRTKRKTLSLQINSNAELIVRAPNRLSVKKIEQFINEKSDWIEKKSNSISLKKPQKPHYINGEKFLYLGEEYPLKINATQVKGLSFNGKIFSLETGGKEEFLIWYKASFKKIALPRLEYYAKNHHLSYNQVRLKAQKTLWGSCSGVNNINLNYLLIGAPISVIDYVIVHELCHSVHKNHSKNFWQLVFSILPNYKASKRWLQVNGHRLQNL
ncbi:SprT family zinc-dependent metalloprotease [Candidatus Thioglobus sp.]|nr:M48 family metallopeptidase [Candidatus Thioglobus sp.]MDC0888361.1 SprT family zinc-dependent metalloprotease [Candidatus Thioglobus sp.]MDC0904349.1 SprT family zinc-dependent metalloprotease [Candidatus Thioglobus sp.]MDC0919928.1 SprT family zinc-dependent metalloprotease [Candidatus Thioglobus sp.]MDC0965093.1 SprT family zinc-dependent metalloprotease [Candidatus Thioglobus sp.]